MANATRSRPRTRDRRRQEIITKASAAVERLFDRGARYSTLSVGRMADEAGISRTTFYVYFEDKADLIAVIAEDVIRQLVATTRFWWDMPPDAGREELREVLCGTYQAFHPHRGVMAYIVEASAEDPALRDRYDNIVEASIAEAAAELAKGIRQSYVDPSLDAPRTAAWICWMIEAGEREVSEPGTKRLLDAYLDGLTAIIWNTLYRGAMRGAH
jgi:AcrR family transcriptional regulator